ncbi:MAG: beta strand repeat-containing protein, partial [bacterium JZ-2024 1]
YGIKSSSGSTVNSYSNTLKGGCGINSSTAFFIDPATGNAEGNDINGGGIAGTTQQSVGVWCDGAGSAGSITNNAINGGNGNISIAKLITNGCVLTESGNTYNSGGQNSYGLWVQNCPAGTIIENHDGVNDGILYGGNGSVTSTALKLKNCNAVVRNNIIDGGSAPIATGIDVDPSNPWIRNNTIVGSQNANTTTSATGVRYSGGSGGTLGDPSVPILGNTITGVTGSANPANSYAVYVDNSSPFISFNTVNTSLNGGQGTNTYGLYITNGSDPIVQFNTINGGTATAQSTGIFNDSTAWNGATGNTISGGTCTASGCSSLGIILGAGTPTIGPSNDIDGGTGSDTVGISVVGTANPTITGNTSISGGIATFESVGIYGTGSPWNSTVSDNTIISGGSCAGCVSFGIYLEAGTPTIGSNNSITGGTGAFTYGIYVTAGANPTILNNTSISGGTATVESIGIFGDTSSWTGTVSNNTISGGTGGTCAGCASYGIRLDAGTPTIGPNNSIDGGSGTYTRGIGVFFSANPTISGNTSISGGNATSQGFGIYGNTSSWTGTVSNNTISGGTCTGCSSYGIRLLGSTPAITGNTITAGTATNAWGVWIGSTPSDFTNNIISGGTGSGFDVDDVRPPGFVCITATGTTTTNFNGSIDDSLTEIGDGDVLDGDVQGPFTIVPELRIANFGNCISGIDTSL